MTTPNTTETPISISYKETHDALELNTHFHNFYEVIFVIDGTVEFKVNGKTHTIESGSMVFISNLESHELKVLDYPYKRYFLLIRPDYFQSVVNKPELYSIFMHRPKHFNHVLKLSNEDKAIFHELIKNIHDELAYGKPFQDIVLSSYLCLLFTKLYRSYNSAFPVTSLDKSTETLLQIQKYIDEHLTEDISLAEVSKKFYTDMYYLSHTFKKVTGFNFKEYLILQRLSKSKELLLNTSDDITSVCSLCGFNNVNHFIRIFKKFEAITPYQYRKKYRR